MIYYFKFEASFLKAEERKHECDVLFTTSDSGATGIVQKTHLQLDVVPEAFAQTYAFCTLN